MEFMEVLTGRRSVRNYLDKRVDAETVCALIDAAVHAPSAMDLQPWEFWVVLGRPRIDEISRRAKEWLLNTLADDPSTAAQARRQHLAPAEATLFHHAPALVMISARSSEEQAIEDCCLAASALMLAARAEGIGTCWVGAARAWLNLPDVKREFGIPPHERVVAPVVLGYPVQWPPAPERRRPRLHWLTCGHEANAG